MEEKRVNMDHQADGLVTDFANNAVKDQLQRILDSPDFEATRRQRALLEFVISQTLAGNRRTIKGYTIATQVFGRGKDFDQAIDPIVSIQANKLRRSLERYYLLSGKNDAIHIDIPKGGYSPVFSKQASAKKCSEPRLRRSRDRHSDDSWPTIVIKPFQNLTNYPENDHWAVGFAAELVCEINQYKWISVLQYSPEEKCRRSSDIGARFIVDGSIRKDDASIKIIVNLIDTKSNKHIWSETHRFENDLTKIVAFQERFASRVGAIVAGEQGMIAKTLFRETKNKHPDLLTTYEAILYYHHFDQTMAPEVFVKAFTALEKARLNEPDCGQIWTLLARLYANAYSLEIPGFDVADSEEKALEYAEKGFLINPTNQQSLVVLGLVRFFSDDIVLAKRDINMAFTLNPNSLYLLDWLGYMKTLLGDWEEGTALIRKAIRHNPYYRTVVHYALWIDCIRQNDLHKASLETTNFRRAEFFWFHLAKSATLGLLGQIEQGEKSARRLMLMKPDFKDRGLILIRRYIKFDDIVEKIVKGLAVVGVKV